jgi:hypothetical protein
MPPFFESRHMPCDECGASVAQDERDDHVCDPDRRLDYILFQLRHEIESFDGDLGEYLSSPQGRFLAWLAERERKRREGE